MPAGMAEEKIPDFRTLRGVIDELPAGTKRQMLERLHMDYKHAPHGTSGPSAHDQHHCRRGRTRVCLKAKWLELPQAIYARQLVGLTELKPATPDPR